MVKSTNSDSTRARLLQEEDLSLEKCIEIFKAAEIADKHMKTLTEQPSTASRNTLIKSAQRNRKHQTGITWEAGDVNGKIPSALKRAEKQVEIKSFDRLPSQEVSGDRSNRLNRFADIYRFKT